MGKRYDWLVTTQNTPRFRERRTLFLTAMGIFVLNLILTGIFLSENIVWALAGAFIFAAFAVVQCFDNRREMWTWGYVIFWVAFSFVVFPILFLWHKAYWWFIGYGIELLAFILLAIGILKTRNQMNFIIDFLLSFFVIILPLIAIVLYAFGVDIPKIVFGIYASVVFIIAGILFITFTALEKFGFGKAGEYFNKLTG